MLNLKKTSKNTKGKIINAAWKLFYEQGYDNTTVEEIIDESGTSKGSFYHYFEGKDALLSSLSYIFDQKYDDLKKSITDGMNCFDALIFLNRELFGMIEESIDMDLLARLLSTQLITKGEKHLLDRNRVYYKLLKSIVMSGQQKKEITSEMSVNEIVKMYAMCERALMYDWCLCTGDYYLKGYGAKIMPMFLSKIRL